MTKVLVMPRHLVPGFYGYVPNCMFNVPAVAAQTDLMLKESVEKDFSRKQPCTYAVIFNPQRKLLCYTRAKKSGEKRLLKLNSIGIGGHVEDKDFAGAETSAYLNTLTRCAERELKEELGVDAQNRLTRIGWLNDNSNDVGEVHLGAIFALILNKGEKTSPSEEVANVKFREIPDIIEDRSKFEPWSQLLLDSIRDWSHFVFRD